MNNAALCGWLILALDSPLTAVVSRVPAAILVCLLLCGPGCDGGEDAGTSVEHPDRSAEALAAARLTLEWLEKNPTHPQTHSSRLQTLDALAWFFISIAHPDPTLRTRAGETLDARLSSIPPPKDEDAIGMTYVAMVLRMKELRGLDLTEDHAALAGTDIPALLQRLDPGTVWFTTELLRRSGLDIEPDFSGSFIARTARQDDPDFEPTRREAVAVFHELIPAIDFGLAEPTVLDERQLELVRRTAPSLIKAAEVSGNTDALAEALVSAALLEQTDCAEYHEGLAALLSRQHPDGTFSSIFDQPVEDANHYRHVVAVGSWALLTSLRAD